MSEVELYASVISLDRVRVYDNLTVRGNGLNSEILGQASKLYVISECLVGGIFFGLRTFTKGKDGTTKYSFGSMSIDQRGTMTVPVFNDLEKSYANWKRDLLNNSNNGYPLDPDCYQNLS